MLKHPTWLGGVCLAVLLSLLMKMGYGQISGQLRDTLAGRNCAQALLSVLRPDSSLIRSTLSAKDGRFQFPGAWPAGNYILLVMHPEYRTLFQQFSVDTSGGFEFGVVPVWLKVDSLQTVVVTQGDLRPHFHRDTVEYNTTHFRMNVNASVEEMLGRLPGLQVDADGNITYNGQKIQRVLVDGRELFGSNLSIVTRNLNADMIAKIQVFDSKTREASFTGIDDGRRIKTLDLTLKEDSKKGYFIKTEGAGARKYYQVNGILGSFKEKEQLMILGLASNNGMTAFNGPTDAEGAGLSISGSTQDALGASAGVGIPQAMGGAVYYADGWGNHGDQADGYYRYSHTLTRPFSSSVSEQILPDSIYTQMQQNNSVNRIDEQSFDSHFTYNPDSLSAFQFALNAGNSRSQNQFTAMGSSSFNNALVNDSRRMISSEFFGHRFSGNIMWRIQGRKRRDCVFSVVSYVSTQNNNTSGYLYSLNHFFYPNGLLQSTDTIDERKSIIFNEANLEAHINYTHPLWEGAILAVGYSSNVASDLARQSTFDRGDGKYLELVNNLSNDYRDLFLTQRGTVNLQGKAQKFDYVLGGDMFQYNYHERNLWNDSLSKYRYWNIAPRFIANYNPSPSVGCAFSYNIATQLPSFTQLQSVRDNKDPLHITLGNPNLLPSYSHTFGFNFHQGGSIIYVFGFNFSSTSNNINTKTYTDSLGRQISQSVNINGAVSGNLYLSLNTRIKPLGLDFRVNGNFAYDRTNNYVNDLLSKNNSYMSGGGISLAKYIANAYNFLIISNCAYNTTSSSINSGQKTSYWSQSHTAQIGCFPWKNWEMNTNLNYTWRQKTSVFDNNNSVFLWNASVNRNFLSNTITARFTVNDIFNQNAGTTRAITANQISQTTSNVIGRYWMVSVLYRLTKKGRK